MDIFCDSFPRIESDCELDMGSSVDMSQAGTSTTYGSLAQFSFSNNTTTSGTGLTAYNPLQANAAGVGDWDKDGKLDLAFAVWGYDKTDAGGEGGAWLAYGPFSGSYTLDTDIGTDKLPGAAISGSLGVALGYVAADDTNLDGCMDLLLGAPGFGDGWGNFLGISYGIYGVISGTGCSRLSSGNASDLMSVSTSGGLTTGDRYVGNAVAIGDVLDADGYPDYIMGATGIESSSRCISSEYAEVTLYSPKTGTTMQIKGENYCDSLGEDVDTGDFNGDGCADIVTGSRSTDYVFPDGTKAGYGTAYLLLQPSTATMVGNTVGYKCLGFQAALISGRKEVSMTDLNVARSGAKTLRGIKFVAEAEIGIKVGSRNAFVGDFNADGYDDIAIGSYDYHPSEPDISAEGCDTDTAPCYGAVYLIYGKPFWYGVVSLDTIELRYGWKHEGYFLQEGHSLKAGRDVSRAGDVNNDGYDDFLIGSQGGTAFLVRGRYNHGYGSSSLETAASVTKLYYTQTLTSKFKGDTTGDVLTKGDTHVFPAGDLNGDSYDDFIVYSTIGLDVNYACGLFFVMPGGCRK